jgi:hypothetical protein
MEGTMQQQRMTTVRRPFGISVIAIILFIQAVFQIIVGIFSFLGHLVTSPLTGLFIGWIPLVMGILLLILARGLWALRPWAYWVTLVLEIVNIVLHFLGYQQAHSLFAIISGGFISIIVVIYLLVDRNVRRAFQTGI